MSRVPTIHSPVPDIPGGFAGCDSAVARRGTAAREGSRIVAGDFLINASKDAAPTDVNDVRRMGPDSESGRGAPGCKRHTTRSQDPNGELSVESPNNHHDRLRVLRCPGMAIPGLGIPLVSRWIKNQFTHFRTSETPFNQLPTIGCVGRTSKTITTVGTEITG